VFPNKTNKILPIQGFITYIYFSFITLKSVS